MKLKETFFVAVFFGLLSCTSSKSFDLNKKNILWVYLEDTAPLMGAYGERLIETPNIDELAKNFTIVIVTHSMQQAARVSQQTAFFHMGNLIEVGKTEEIFSMPKQVKTQKQNDKILKSNKTATKIRESLTSQIFCESRFLFVLLFCASPSWASLKIYL